MTTHTISLGADTLPLTYSEQGSGRPYLLLHGGAGPASLSGLAAALASAGRVLLPTHPGFDGLPRPAGLGSVADLTTLYLLLLERLDLQDVVVVGNSVGGWLALELGLRASPRIAAVVVLNAVGLEPTAATGPILDPATIAPAERGTASFHDPARYSLAPTSPEALARMGANQQVLRVYAGEPFMYSPTLRERLPQLALPTLVLWGASDRIVTPAYGQQLAALVPGARFELVPQAGHFPQVEQLPVVLEHLQQFLA